MKFREIILESGICILLGRNAENNEQLIKQVKKDEIVLHTDAPGSPFVNIKGEADKKDIKESAIFCAKYSQDWRDNKRDIEVHWFKGKDIYKRESMKTGTFGVKKFKVIKVKKEYIEKCQK